MRWFGRGLDHRATMRFSELQRAISQATPKMLVQQLREMEADELVSRSDVREVAFTGVADHECRRQKRSIA